MFCYKCGTQLVGGSEFCHNCGARAQRAVGQEEPKPQQSRPVVSGASSGVPSSSSAAVNFQHEDTWLPPATLREPVAQNQGPSTASVWSIICSVLAVLFTPLLFGAIAIYLGYRAKKSGDRAGDMLMICAVIATIVGLALGAIVWTQLVQ